MSATVACPKCGKMFEGKGDRGQESNACPHCQAVEAARIAASGDVPVREAVPTSPVSTPRDRAGVSRATAPSTAERPRSPSELRRAILDGFQGEIPPTKLPLAYRFGVCLVTVVMVILPLVYIALIGLVCYLVYLHAVHNTTVFGIGVRGRAAVVPMLLYAGPLVAGAILVLFMIKPLFARPAKPPTRRSLTRDDEPFLYAFVDRVCGLVRAPAPRRIDVDCQVNASASFRRGLLSMLGNDLVLTIGMPLAAGLSLRQFAGVLAHEFGHFSQGAGMRLTYVIRSISWWFTRVVYERDAWDQRLIEWSENSDWRIALVLVVSRFFVWLTRGVLWVLMMTGHAVSGLLLRQMEFDADRYETRLAGSDTFESTCRQLMVLNVANQGARSDLETFYQEGRLGDNLPRLVTANIPQIPAEIHVKLREAVEKNTTKLLDTHPSDKDRIASARREDAQGVFHIDCPASVVFADFDALSREVTSDFYREVLGPRFNPADVRPIDDLLMRQTKEEEAGKALRRYVQGNYNPLRPLPLPSEPLAAPANARDSAIAMKAARERIPQLRPAYDKAFTLFDDADTKALQADQAEALLKAGFAVSPSTFGVSISGVSDAVTLRRDAAVQQKQATEELARFENVVVARLFHALSLLHVPKVAARIEDAQEKQGLSAEFLAALRRLNELAPSVLQLRNQCASLGVLVGNLEGNRQHEKLIAAIRSHMETVRKHLADLRQELRAYRYPLGHGKGDVSIGEYVIESIPSQDDLGGILNASASAAQILPTLYVRLVARLTNWAEEVETVLGLAPLPEPPPETACESSNA